MEEFRLRIKRIILKGSGTKINIPEHAITEIIIREVQDYVPVLDNSLVSDEEKGFTVEVVGYRPYLSITTSGSVTEILEEEIAVIVRENEEDEII